MTQRYWLTIALVVLAITLLFLGRRQLPAAQAQLHLGAGDDISVVPMQIDRDSFGVAMVDKAAQTIWIYEINSRGTAQPRLRLLAARSWKYDRQLEDLNNTDPRPEHIKAMLKSLEEQRQENKAASPTINTLDMAEPNIN